MDKFRSREENSYGIVVKIFKKCNLVNYNTIKNNFFTLIIDQVVYFLYNRPRGLLYGGEK